MPQLILASRGRITHPFGARNPAGSGVPIHQGVDTGHGNGLDVFAPAAGFASARSSGGAPGTYGNYWWINHDDGTASIVAHLARHIGGSRRVAQREVIGVMGNTGTVAVHCHQEYIVDGRRVDPTKYLAGVAGGDSAPLPPLPEEDDMTHYELRRTPDGTVWWIVDRMFRYGLSETEDATRYQAFLEDLGRDPAIYDVSADAISGFGVPVFDPSNPNSVARQRDIPSSAGSAPRPYRLVLEGVATPT
jgi:hypothetical protein